MKNTQSIVIAILIIIKSYTLFAQQTFLIPYRKSDNWGYCDNTKKIIIPCKFSQTLMFVGQFAKVRLDDKWGLIDTLGNLVIPLKYNKLVKIEGTIYYGEIKSMKYLLNTKGDIKIIKYESINYINNGIFKIRENNKYGLLDTTGKEILFPNNTYINDFNFGYSLVTTATNDKFLIDKYGKKLELLKGFYVNGDFHEGLAIISLGENNNKKYGYSNTNGDIIIPCVYDYASFFHEGFAYIQNKNKVGYININGKEIIPPIYEQGRFDNRWKFFVLTLEKKQGSIDTLGNIIIPFKYDDIQYYKNGRAIVGINKKYGVIDSSGKEVLPIIYDRIWEMDGFYNLTQGTKIGLANYNGKILVPIEYGLILGFSCNRGIIYCEHKKGYINMSGSIVVPCMYDCASSFYKNTAWVCQNSKYGLIDTIGNTIIPNKYQGIWEYEIDETGSPYRFVTKPEKDGLTMTKKIIKKYFVRKYKHPTCSNDKYLFRWDFVRKITEWNGYVDRNGIEYFED